VPRSVLAADTPTWDARPFVPASADLVELGRAAADCRGCDLYAAATQTVFGAGAAEARVLLVGEQPGDREDRLGQPFVGPAGQVLAAALAAAEISPELVYTTNVVKHFKFELRGKRRIHSKPNRQEIRACKPWLEAELRLIRPTVLICLGATAAQALLGPQFRITRQRGELLAGTGLAPVVVATVHPASILRAPTEAARQAAREAFTADLRRVGDALRRASG